MLRTIKYGVPAALVVITTWAFMDWIAFKTGLYIPSYKDYWLVFLAAFAGSACTVA